MTLIVNLFRMVSSCSSIDSVGTVSFTIIFFSSFWLIRLSPIRELTLVFAFPSLKKAVFLKKFYLHMLN